MNPRVGRVLDWFGLGSGPGGAGALQRTDVPPWYPSVSSGQQAASGVRVTADSALTVSAVYGCVKVLAETLASVPLIMYRRRPDGGKERAEHHPLYALLHDAPNGWQTSFEWREQLMEHLLLRGNAYCQIVEGPRGPVDQLIPIHPDRVKVEQLTGGRLRYRVTPAKGKAETLTQEQVFHLRGLSSDGISGLSVITLARETVGLAIALEEFGARLFSQGARPGGVLETPNKLSKESSERLSASWHAAHSGLSKAHKVAVLEEGLTFKPLSIAPEDAQFLESRRFSIAEIARWFRVPLHLLGELESGASYASVEMLGQEFVIYTMLAWFRRWEQVISKSLIAAPQTYFAEFLVDGLMRGNMKDRYEAYNTAIQGGWMVRNEARERENFNKLDGLDAPLEPLNMTPAGTRNTTAPGAAVDLVIARR